MAQLQEDEIRERKTAAELAIRVMGITFTVYDDGANIAPRSWPFDIVPRLILKHEWDRVAQGLKQRVRALNAFIDDVYHHRRSLRDGVVPADYVLKSRNTVRAAPGSIRRTTSRCHVCGSDLVRDHDGKLYVLEDNLRVPSGVLLHVGKPRRHEARVARVVRGLPDPSGGTTTRHASHVACARWRRPNRTRASSCSRPHLQLRLFRTRLSGTEMAVDLVEGPDLVVDNDDCVYVKTIGGLARVDIIYRRVDDLFLDPKAFRNDSLLGVPGLIRAWQAGNVALANAPGCGIADDKVIYTYVPDMIRYFLGEEPILDNVPSYRCAEEEQREFVLDNLQDLVVKPANESGGYGILIGPHSSVQGT